METRAQRYDLACIVATPFAAGGAVDEGLLRAYFRRFKESRIGLFLGSAGSSESHCLTEDELRLVYDAAMAECGGTVTVQAMPPEQISAAATIRHVELAARAGVDVINIYMAEGRHGLRLTEPEQRAFYRTVFGLFPGPFGLCVSPTVGTVPRVELVAEICNTFENIVQVLLMRVPEMYLIDLKRLLKRDASLVVEFETGALNALALGAGALFSSEANILPRTSRAFMESWRSGDRPTLASTYSDLKRFRHFVRSWGAPSARWIKMCIHALGLPGCQGGVREPLLLPGDSEMSKFREGLAALGIAELTQAMSCLGEDQSKNFSR